MTSIESAWLTAVLLTLMVACWLMSVIPWCDDPECSASHKRHTLATRSASIEKNHVVFHDPLRPQVNCALCQARKRDEP